jgi:2Fe-2S ferredoxin
MPRIIFIEPDGTRREVQATVGLSVMETALQHGIRGIVATCGGACACSTCHGYVDEAWFPRLDEPDELELGTLQQAPDVRPNSRLTCQVSVTPELDGLTIRVPARQA